MERDIYVYVLSRLEWYVPLWWMLHAKPSSRCTLISTSTANELTCTYILASSRGLCRSGPYL